MGNSNSQVPLVKVARTQHLVNHGGLQDEAPGAGPQRWCTCGSTWLSYCLCGWHPLCWTLPGGGGLLGPDSRWVDVLRGGVGQQCQVAEVLWDAAQVAGRFVALGSAWLCPWASRTTWSGSWSPSSTSEDRHGSGCGGQHWPCGCSQVPATAGRAPLVEWSNSTWPCLRCLDVEWLGDEVPQEGSGAGTLLAGLPAGDLGVCLGLQELLDRSGGADWWADEADSAVRCFTRSTRTSWLPRHTGIVGWRSGSVGEQKAALCCFKQYRGRTHRLCGCADDGRVAAGHPEHPGAQRPGWWPVWDPRWQPVGDPTAAGAWWPLAHPPLEAEEFHAARATCLSRVACGTCPWSRIGCWPADEACGAAE